MLPRDAVQRYLLCDRSNTARVCEHLLPSAIPVDLRKSHWWVPQDGAYPCVQKDGTTQYRTWHYVGPCDVCRVSRVVIYEPGPKWRELPAAAPPRDLAGEMAYMSEFIRRRLEGLQDPDGSKPK